MPSRPKQPEDESKQQNTEADEMAVYPETGGIDYPEDEDLFGMREDQQNHEEQEQYMGVEEARDSTCHHKKQVTLQANNCLE